MLVCIKLINMKSYLVTIIIVSVGMSLFEMLAPTHNGIERYIRSISLLVILVFSIYPIIDLIKDIDLSALDELKEEIIIDQSSENYQEILSQYLNSYSIDKLKDTIKETLDKKFNIPNNECEIKVNTEISDGQIILTKVTVLLMGRSIFQNPYNIENYLKELLGCESIVLIKNE